PILSYVYALLYFNVLCLITISLCRFIFLSFFSNYPTTTYIYTLSLHDALPISLAEFRNSPCYTTWARLTKWFRTFPIQSTGYIRRSRRSPIQSRGRPTRRFAQA